MKKFGLTLSELVVAVSVIGIAASLIVPVVSKLVPDTRKSTVLKYNALINNVIAEFYNSNYYAPQATLQEEGGEATTSDCTGISCFRGDAGIADFKGHSYLFYHTGELPGGHLFHRSVCVAEFEYKEDGSIDTIAKCDGIYEV